MLVAAFFVVLVFGLLALASVTYWSMRNGIVPMPSSTKAVRAITSLLPTGFQGVCLELGSGWGTLLAAINARCPEARIIGYETSHLPFVVARCLLWRRRNLALHCTDFFKADISKADLVICYLYLGAMQRLKAKMLNELKDGTIVISNTFAIFGWTPEQVVEIEDFYRTTIYLYRVRSADRFIGQ